MEHKQAPNGRIDLLPTLANLWRMLKHIWAIGMLLVAIFAVLTAIITKQSYQPVYEASASFTVKVVNPLYATANGYNVQTAEQMEKTFPYILSSDALRQRVKEHLGVSSLPAVSADVLTGTNVFTLRVRASDPQWAYEVLQAVMVCYPEVADFVVGPTNMVLLNESGIPAQPIAPYSLPRSLVLGALIGLLAWIAVALCLSIGRNTIHNEDDLKSLLNFSCLGALPATKVVSKHSNCPLIHEDHGKAGFAEAAHLLSLHLEKALKEQKKQILLVSSAVPGEGKTTVSANFAIALAQNKCRVLLVDCDLRNPSVAKAFGLENRDGLADYLEERQTVARILNITELPGLHVIVGGSCQKSNPEDLLSSPLLEQLLTSAKKNFDYVILDTSPCGLLADASEVAELAECAVMVVRQDFASRSQILDGARFLTDSKLPLVGSVLNGIRGHGRYGYGGYYSYGYGYGYSYGKSKSRTD